MNLFVVGSRGFPHVQGGIERHCERLYPRLVERGCEVTVVARTPYIPSDQRRKEWKGVRIIHAWSPHSKYSEAIVHTFLGILIARIHSPDFLHVHAIGPSLLIPFACLLGLKVVMTHHGPDYQRKKWGWCAKFILKLGEWMGLLCARRVIVVSQSVRNYLIQRFKRNDIVFIPNGVERGNEEPSQAVLSSYGLEPDKYFLAVSRFVPEKGLHDLIAAYERMPSCTCKLAIVGGADHETRYSRHLKRMTEKNTNIIVTGVLHPEELHHLYSYARAFVLPSYYEGLPITLLEALSYGCQVIASDIPATREIPVYEDAYFPAGDVDALAERLEKASRTPFTQQQRAYYSNLAKSTYNWDRIADRTCALLQRKR